MVRKILTLSEFSTLLHSKMSRTKYDVKGRVLRPALEIFGDFMTLTILSSKRNQKYSIPVILIVTLIGLYI